MSDLVKNHTCHVQHSSFVRGRHSLIKRVGAMTLRTLLLLLLALSCARSITHPQAAPGSLFSPVRPKKAVAPVPIAPGHSGEEDEVLLQVRTSMQQVRRLRRRAKMQAQQLSTGSRAAAEAVLAEAKQYESALADLEHIQHQLLRSAKAGLMIERRNAERAWRKWRRSGRDDIS